MVEIIQPHKILVVRRIVIQRIEKILTGNTENVYILADGKTMKFPTNSVPQEMNTHFIYNPLDVSSINLYTGINEQQLLDIYKHRLNNNNDVLKAKLKFLCSRF